MLPALSSNSSSHHHNSSNPKSSLKRSSSMIFRIEHLLPSASAPDVTMSHSYTLPTTSATEASSKNSKTCRAGVHVSQFTPKDTVSEKLNTISLLGTTDSNSGSRSYCHLSHGVLSISPGNMRKIKLSEDIHSYNALFELHEGAVRIRVMKDITSNDELVAWFGEEVTLLMSIPFLTPFHIQGNNRYTCHLCHLTFETPNPLKIHLALGCGRQSMDILWIRLHYALIKTSHYSQHVMTCVPTTSLSPNRPQQASSSSSNTISPSCSPQPASARFSAFRPIASSASTAISTATTITSVASSLSLPQLHSSLTYLPSIPTSSSLMPAMSLLQPPNPLNAAAQIEAIVSNMGASKQGHLCIYCGKVYSRKYGLKIHIRTHTGFKPLKCKFCLRPFGDPSNLNKHVRLHLQTSSASNGGVAGSLNVDTQGYQCLLCHKTLVRRRDLQRHMETRHSDGASHELDKN